MSVRGGLDVSKDQYRRLRAVLWSLQAATAASVCVTLVLSTQVSATLLVAALALICGQVAVCLQLGKRSEQALSEREEWLRESQIAHQQIEILFAMTDLLQSSDSIKDAGMVLENTTHRLMPNYSGAIYVFNKSTQRLEITRKWGQSNPKEPLEAIEARRCWSLKRGKLHVNNRGPGALLCKHYTGDVPNIEVPMMARGALHGLLILTPNIGQPLSSQNLEHDVRLAQAMSDSLSLALSNIELRERLRMQSLRDPLTGLYNRRYMEEAMELTLASARRTNTPTSILMIDLDNFKLLNDDHGHAMGDIVLRDVAHNILSALRPADIVSRYGGEEILVILPECSHEDALVRGEMLRKRIESLSTVHEVTVSASFGVATAPEMADTTAEIIARADSALYAAKHSGRNCIMSADPEQNTDAEGMALEVLLG